jgi:hypothetical protein
METTLLITAVLVLWGVVGSKYAARETRALHVPDDPELAPDPTTFRGALQARQDGRWLCLLVIWPVLAVRQRRADRALRRREEETLAAIRRGER